MSGSVTSTNAINTGTGATITLNGNPSSLPLALVTSSPYDYSFSTQLELVQGNNSITVTAIDSQNHSGSDTVTVTALIPVIGIRAELTWNTDGTDLDSHLIAPCYAENDSFGDCCWHNKNPNWGGSSASNPSLDQDVTTGYGPEYVVLQSPPFNGVYQYKVYYYDDNGHGPSTATVKIWINDELVFQGNKTLSDEQWWDCACISWSSGTGTVTAGPCSLRTLTVTSQGCCPILVGSLPCGEQTVSAGATREFYGITPNSNITLTAQTGDFCEFENWTVDGEVRDSGNSIEVPMDTDHVAVATCIPLYTLTVTNDGCHTVHVTGLPNGEQGEVGGNATFVLPEGTEVTLTPSDSDGIVFTGWYVDAEQSPQFDRPLIVTMYADHQVTAVCVGAHPLDVISNGCCPILVEGLPGGNRTVPAGDAAYLDAPENADITLTAQTGNSCQFGNWTVDGQPPNVNQTTEVNETIVIHMDTGHDVTAWCTPLYTLTVTSEGCCSVLVSNLPEGNQTVPAGGNGTFSDIPQGTVVTLEAVEDGNCTFDYWEVHSTDGDYIYDKVIQVTMNSDHTATAVCNLPEPTPIP